MLDTATTALLRAVLEEVCEGVSRHETGARTHVASKFYKPPQRGKPRPTVCGRSATKLSRVRRRCGDNREAVTLRSRWHCW